MLQPLLTITFLGLFYLEVQAGMAFSLCNDDLQATLKSWGHHEPFTKLHSRSKDRERYVSPSRQMGTWIYVETDPSSRPITLVQQSQFELLKVSYDSKCNKTLGYSVNKTPELVGEATDKHLLNWAKTFPDFLVYIWSPEMPLSLANLANVKAVASKMKIPLFVRLYAGSSPEIAKAVAQKNNYPDEYLQKLNSFELAMRDASQHRPVLYRIKNGQLVKSGIHGLVSTKEYLSLFKRWDNH